MNCLYIGYDQQAVRFSQEKTVFLSVKKYDEVVNNFQPQFDLDYRLDKLCKEWLVEFTNAEIIVVELDWFESGDYLGARFANHIRLTKWSNEKLRDMPIVLIRDKYVDIVLRDMLRDDLLIFVGQGALFSTYSDLIATFYEKWPVMEELTALQKLVHRHNQKYHFKKYLDALKFSEQHEDSHSITNQWGALRLAHNIGYISDDIEYKWPPKLYFKYLQAKYDFKPITSPTQIIAKILLIDDNTDKGWEKVLKKLFKFDDNNPTLDEKGRPTFVTVNEKVKDYDSLSEKSRIIIEEQDFDLYLVDLRLNGADEDITTETRNFSGATVLQKIKSLNAGNQVIMFTASNKAWNMRALLSGENAADGYYIKESPLNASDKYFGKNNTKSFLQQIDLALESKFLKEVARFETKCFLFIESDLFNRQPEYQNFYYRAISALKVGFELCKKSVSDKKYFNLAYLTYYQILEDYAGQEENFEYISDRECYINNKLIRVIDDSSGSLIWQLKFINDANQWPYFRKRDKTCTDSVKVLSLAKISFILAFKFRKGDAFLLNWGELNHIRNQKAGHGGANGLVYEEELFKLLKVVELFLTNR